MGDQSSLHSQGCTHKATSSGMALPKALLCMNCLNPTHMSHPHPHTHTHTLGIDIAKAKFDVALHRTSTAPVDTKLNKYHLKDKTAKFANTEQGFEQLLEWLNKHPISLDTIHFAMEATGIYYEALALFLLSKGVYVSVVNPAAISGYAKAGLTRVKTDKADAKLIAAYCASMRPKRWIAPAPQVRHLRELTRRLVDLKDLRQQEHNRIGQARTTYDSISAVLEVLDTQIKQVGEAIKAHIDRHPGLKEQAALLDTIPGLGSVTIGTLLAEVEFDRFDRAPKLAAFTGLVPCIRVSGTSLNKSKGLSKAGAADLRRSLYMPAVVAMQFNPVIKAFYARLLASGKSKLQAVCACMRKLLCIAYGVLKSKQPFNPNYAAAA
jgi:transposase